MFPRIAQTTKFSALTTSQCELHVDQHNRAFLKKDDDGVDLKINTPLNTRFIPLENLWETVDKDEEINVLVLVSKVFDTVSQVLTSAC